MIIFCNEDDDDDGNNCNENYDICYGDMVNCNTVICDNEN